MKTTKFRIDNTTISVESDDPQMHELLARLVVEKAGGRSAPAPSEAVIRKAVHHFLRRCRQEPTQSSILSLLAKSGRATRAQMLAVAQEAAKAAGSKRFREGNRSLAGCRGSMSKKAQGLGLGENWWQDSWSEEERDHITILDDMVFKYLKEAIAQEK